MKKVSIWVVIFIVIMFFGFQQVNAQERIQDAKVSLKNINEFYVGNTDKQSLIHSYIPMESNKTPVIMLPGLGLGANIYKSTPDGRNGWVYDFLAASYPVYTVDTSDLASAGITKTEANGSLTKWNSQMIWSRWGLGPQPNQSYPEGKFPVNSFEQFDSSIPMRISVQTSGQQKGSSKNIKDKEDNETESEKLRTKKGQGNRFGVSQQEVANMIQLLEKTGPSILVIHSMGGEIGYEVTRQRPDLVEGIVAIEPVGSPTDKEEIKEIFSKIPYLGVYGDYLKSRNQIGRLEAVKKTTQLINENGGQAEVLRLTEKGINGNSHLMMIDKNNHQIASLIIKWLNEKN